MASHLNTTPQVALKALPALSDALSKMNQAQANNYGKSLGLDQSTIYLLQQGRREVEATIRTEEVVAEVETPVLEEESFDVEAFKKDLSEMLAQFSADVDKKIETVKVEFSEAKEVLAKENEDLKVELAKEPEVAPLKAKPTNPSKDKGGLVEFLNNNL